MTRLIEIKPSNRKGKKYSAVFQLENGKQKTTAFGASGMSDFIQYSKGDPVYAEERKRLYLLRHQANESYNDPTSAATLSKYILWNRKTLEASIADYKKRFHL